MDTYDGRYYENLVRDLRTTLEDYGIAVADDGGETLAHQAYRLAATLGAAALAMRLGMRGDLSWSAEERRAVMAAAHTSLATAGGTSLAGDPAVWVDMASENIFQAIAVIDKLTGAEQAPALFALVAKALSAAGLLLHAVLADDEPDPMMDGDEPVVLPAAKDLFAEGHLRLRQVVDVLDAARG